MFRMNRRQPGFDSLESVVLLATGVAAASRSAHVDAFPGAHLELNGTLARQQDDLGGGCQGAFAGQLADH